MKKIYVALVAVASLTLAGCAKVNEGEAPQGREITITATCADNQTKTTLQDGGTDVYWEAADEVKLFYDGTGSRFTNQYTEPSVTAKFTGSLNVAFLSNEGFSSSTPLIGLYPYRADATADNSSVTTTLPAEQTGRAGSFAKGMNISIGKSTSLSMGFYNVCGGIRFSVIQEGVKEVVFKGQNDESIAGKVKLTFDGNIPVVDEVVEGVTEITLTAPSGGAFETGKWYYIVALPTALSNGFKMTFNTDTQYATLKSSSAKTISRGTFGSLADADEGLIYKDKGTPEPPTGTMSFRDFSAEVACTDKFDANGDGVLTYEEAAAVIDISGLFTDYPGVAHFDELQYFTSLSSIGTALKSLTKLESVTVPAQITSIPDYAFDGCTALDSLTFAGDNIASIGQYAFRNCAALTDFDVPSKVTTIGQYAFSGCTSLAGIDLPDGLASLGSYAFKGCTALATVDIPSGITVLPYACFQSCSTLATVGLPSGLTSIGNYAFDGCNALATIDFPVNLQILGEYSLRNCKTITTASVPNTVTSFGNGVFYGCSKLESAVLPSGLTSVPYETFYGCVKLYSVTFPENVTTIGNRAFYNCLLLNPATTVSKISLPASVTSIGTESFNKVRNVLVNSATNVTIVSNSFGSTTKIYVPDAKVETYKIKANWLNYADRIYGLSTYEDQPLPSGAVEMGLSVLWASCNVGATKPEEYGTYFAWGDVVGQSWSGSSWSGGGFSTCPSYELDANNNLKPEYDAAHVNLGGTWRMPTEAEQHELINNCTCTWTSDYEGTGVAGRVFTSNITGNSIFLPAAGYGDNSHRDYAGSCGVYWSSSLNTGYTNYAWDLNFNLSNVSTYSGRYRSYGLSVRPVTE